MPRARRKGSGRKQMTAVNWEQSLLGLERGEMVRQPLDVAWRGCCGPHYTRKLCLLHPFLTMIDLHGSRSGSRKCIHILESKGSEASKGLATKCWKGGFTESDEQKLSCSPRSGESVSKGRVSKGKVKPMSSGCFVLSSPVVVSRPVRELPAGCCARRCLGISILPFGVILHIAAVAASTEGAKEDPRGGNQAVPREAAPRAEEGEDRAVSATSRVFCRVSWHRSSSSKDLRGFPLLRPVLEDKYCKTIDFKSWRLW